VARSSITTVSSRPGLPARNTAPPDVGAVIAATAMSLAPGHRLPTQAVRVELGAGHADADVTWRSHQA
jgi:hypothetical protein